MDTSALGRVLLDEPDAASIKAVLGGYQRFVSSRLLHVELWRLARRHDLLANAARMVADVSFVPVDADVLADAEAIEPATVATLDAIHLATAVRIARTMPLDVLTFDRAFAAGAAHHGLTVVAPA